MATAKKPRTTKAPPLPAEELMEFAEAPLSAAAKPVEALSSLAESPAPAPAPAAPQPAAKPAPAVLPESAATCAHCGVAVAKPVTVRRVSAKGVVTFETYAPGHRSDRG